MRLWLRLCLLVALILCLAGFLYRYCRTWFIAPSNSVTQSLPQTASQKLARGELKRMASQCVAEGEAFDLRAAKRRHA